MPNSRGGTIHVFVVVGEGVRGRVAWSEVRAQAIKRSAWVSVSTIEASGVRLLLPAKPATDAPAELVIPDNLGLPVTPVGERILDQIFEARSSVPSIQRTEVRLYADEDTKTELTNHLKSATDIDLIVGAVSAKRRTGSARPVANVSTQPKTQKPAQSTAGRRSRGDDLDVEVNISPDTASNGGVVRVTVPGGAGSYGLKLPPHTGNGTIFRLRGKGKSKPGGDHGDLLVKVVVRYPQTTPPKPSQPAQTNPQVSHPQSAARPPSPARQTTSSSRASATPTSGHRAPWRAPKQFRDSVRGAFFWAALAAAGTATGLHLLSHRGTKSAVITAALMWLLAVLLSAARHFIPQPDTSVIRIARAGRVLVVIALAVATYHMLMQLKVQPDCGLSCTTLPASSWKAIPIAVVIGTWASYILNLGIDIQLAGWTTAKRKPARWLALPAGIIGAASVGSEVLMRIDHVIATVAPGNSIVGSAVDSADGSFPGAVVAVRGFLEPYVSALPGWATSVLPTFATLSGLAMFLGAKDLQRWSPWALPLTRLLVIALGLPAGALILWSHARGNEAFPLP